MLDRSNEPLTDEERRVFGDAKRAPSGEVIEQGVKIAGRYAQPSFNARADEPLTPLERSIWGQDAVRRSDGSISERGSSHDPDVLAARAEARSQSERRSEADARARHAKNSFSASDETIEGHHVEQPSSLRGFRPICGQHESDRSGRR
jgi:hypothetical protein